jgi:lysozyme
MAGVSGFDVSSYQGSVDWAAVAGAGLGFAYVKATEGLTFNDPQFARNWSVSKERGIPRGAYHFFHFNDDPVAQAEFFLASAAPNAGDLLPAVDVEVTDGVTDVTRLVDALSAFITRVEQAMAGKRMLVYTGFGFWNASFHGSDAFAGHPLWIAEYNGDATPVLPGGWNNWIVWQHSSNGTVPGITGSVDLNVLNGDAAALLQITV